MKTTIVKIITTLVFLGSGLMALAQGPANAPVNPIPTRDPLDAPGDAPIDGALVWLLVLGVAFGVYMVAKKRQQVRN